MSQGPHEAMLISRARGNGQVCMGSSGELRVEYFVRSGPPALVFQMGAGKSHNPIAYTFCQSTAQQEKSLGSREFQFPPCICLTF